MNINEIRAKLGDVRSKLDKIETACLAFLKDLSEVKEIRADMAREDMSKENIMILGQTSYIESLFEKHLSECL